MKKDDILITTALSLFVAIAAPVITHKFSLDPIITVLIIFNLISFFWIGSYVKEVLNSSKGNTINVNKNKREIYLLRKDLNIERRLSTLENWRDNLK